MRTFETAAHPVLIAIAMLVTAAAPAAAQPGAVMLTGGAGVPQNPTLPALHLNNAQRENIRKAVLTEHTEVQFRLKSTKSAKDFTPAVGAKLPKGLKAIALPQGLLQKLPQLRDYKYLKVKDEVLIVNPMTDTVVDMFAETRPVA